MTNKLNYDGKFFKISAVTKDGIKDLNYFLIETLKNIPKLKSVKLMKMISLLNGMIITKIFLMKKIMKMILMIGMKMITMSKSLINHNFVGYEVKWR